MLPPGCETQRLAIVLSQVDFLDACHRRGGLQSPVWALGSLQFIDLDVYLERRGLPPAASRDASSTARLLREQYGIEEYLDFDLNEDAAVQLDLGAPLPDEWRGGAGTVIDAGTLEHIFDLGQVLRNVHDMLRAGGTMVMIAPVSWWQHGFVNFNPKLFYSVAAANGYELLVEGFWFRIRAPLLGTKIFTVLIRDGAPMPRRKLWIDRMMARVQPARTIYLCCCRKTRDAPFQTPLDIFGNFYWDTPASVSGG